MATLWPARATSRPPRQKNAVNTYIRRGRAIAQSWPKKRGKYRDDRMRASTWRQDVTVIASKLMRPQEYMPLNEALIEFLAKHTGLRGTAAIRTRDWFTQLITGRLWAWATPTSTSQYPATVRGDASDVLDWIEPRLGSVPVRTPTGWLGTTNLRPGEVFVSTGTEARFTNCPNATIPGYDDAMGGM